jgi:hypothetical protein
LREKRPGVFEIRVAVGVDPMCGRTVSGITEDADTIAVRRSDVRSGSLVPVAG